VPDDCLNPVLVGGTGRSGSTILGRLLNRHPDLVLTNPEEVRFIANEGGMATTLATARSPWPRRLLARRETERAVRKCLGAWFKRPGNSGLQMHLSHEEMTALGQDYLAGMRTDPLQATRTMTYAVMAAVASQAQGRRWVDGTPANARVTDLIEPIYPLCQVISIIRDGRDVAASFVEQSFGPKDVFSALDMWAKRSARMQLAVRRCEPGRILTIEMLDLVRDRRHQTLEEVCAFLHLDVDPSLRAWFDENVTADRAHIGRWKEQFDEPTRQRINEHYARLVERLRRQDVPIPREA